MRTHTHTQMPLNTYPLEHTSARTLANTHIHTNTLTHAHSRILIYTHNTLTHAHLRTLTYTHKHTDARTLAHTHIHTHSLPWGKDLTGKLFFSLPEARLKRQAGINKCPTYPG